MSKQSDLVGFTQGSVKLTVDANSTEEDVVLIQDSNDVDVASLRINNGAFIVKGKNASQPVQLQTHDGNEDIEVDPDGFIKMETAGSERLRIDASGNVGIGTSSPTVQLHIKGNDGFLLEDDGTTNYLRIQTSNAGDGVFYTGSIGGSIAERLRITSAGSVGIGTSSPSHNLTVGGTAASDFVVALRGGVGGFFGWDDSANSTILQSPNTRSLVFRVNSDTFSAGTEAMRINASGNVYVPNDISVGTTDVAPAANNVAGHSLRDNGRAEFSSDGGVTVYVNRLQDGTLMSFRSAGNGEGSISVSGTTVSYNGGHLSRWSQTADNTRIDLLKGTVMTNLDQMAVWGDEDNEQLNCMAVSSVEGDPNVAGVFVNWDDDDEDYVNDMNIAMTGDMIIRIAQGTIVQRGDLLMSAGDGTAKPQGDDIIRSKTIAKVTSTHVTCTYEDGSYCVPCVLMAC